MSHTAGHIIINRVINTAKSSVTGDNKWASLIIAIAGAVGGGYFF